jgi:hypothetical protein
LVQVSSRLAVCEGGKIMKTRRLFIALGSLIAITTIGFLVPSLFKNNQTIETGSSPVAVTAVPDQAPVPILNITPIPSSGRQENNCTYPLAYWEERPETWPGQVVIAETAYSREEMLQIFSLSETEPAYHLLKNLYTTFLNVLYGADITAVESTILDADAWLASNPPGSQLSELNRRMGNELAEILDGYNNGVFGPGICPDIPQTSRSRAGTAPERGQTEVARQPLTATSVSDLLLFATSTSQPVLLISTPLTDNPEAPSPTDTPEPAGATPTPTLIPTLLPPPTSTSGPTSAPSPTPQPTDSAVPPSPVPTNTPQPTSTPQPTNTSLPPPPDGTCVGTLGPISVDDIRVPTGATCTLNGTRVDGNVTVESGATLFAVSVDVDGNIDADRASLVVVEAGSYVDGNIDISRSGTVVVDSSQVGGNLKAEANTGGVTISNNTIHGNLQCKDNNPPPTGGGNTVYGNSEDQCADL